METTTPRVPPVTIVGGLLIFAALMAGGITLSSRSCRASVDAVAALEPVDVVTGWFDDGILEDGKNKLVPSVSLKFRNKSAEELKSIQVNAIFRRVGEQEMWGEYFGWAVPRDPVLAAGAETAPLVMRSALGYTGEQPRMQMLQNKEFVDAKVEIFLKQGAQVWAKLAEYPIQRQLLTR
ncbi:MAG: hypothetical protein Q8O42_05520 [Acidobacteriota bacterium]|nr:hypothetical protein [Acidobacteriota bacterium]